MNVNDVQRSILRVVAEWVKTEKTPIPQSVILVQVTKDTLIPDSTIKAAVRILVHKGYIRKAVTFQNGAAYVQIRSL